MSSMEEDQFSEDSSIDESQKIEQILEIESKIPDILSYASNCIDSIETKESIEEFNNNARSFFQTLEYVSTGLRKQVLDLEKAEVPLVSLQPRKHYVTEPLTGIVFDEANRLL
ncbi:mediator complex subunit Med11 [Schizosaccharomyces octosporus yFS286]|uniref:Mediator of RNA polymerase II transcription subunit 11 n=1 Tax=Schizosaccharomyces octosporus (strain yFS286) TaxID=483514 RepID=S9PZI4_SCHOY|nr:mediator complex subunit Med11 [Schizosaccharomyces octosporus yFS286]EPX72868.1 mediator complex subunit Med11 [Schizosaccharomyces octosporus yFS286]